jgi:hypothetical protein
MLFSVRPFNLLLPIGERVSCNENAESQGCSFIGFVGNERVLPRDVCSLGGGYLGNYLVNVHNMFLAVYRRNSVLKSVKNKLKIVLARKL